MINSQVYIPTAPAIIYQQRRWAAARGIQPNGNYTKTLEENLFQPLTEASRAEFGSGAGNEMSEKMRAFHSSSALVCNVFDYWRDRPLKTLASALGAPVDVDHLHFEQVYPTGLRGMPPHLDVLLCAEGFKPFLIESKFTEPYSHGGQSAENAFTKSYFPNSGELWGKYGLTRCEDLAQRIYSSREHFSRLDAPQLLKHILGLAKEFGENFTLLYLWYDHASSGAAEHRAEIETFLLRLNGEIDFRAMTYQELFQRMQGNQAIDQSYIKYLKERYFA